MKDENKHEKSSCCGVHRDHQEAKKESSSCCQGKDGAEKTANDKTEHSDSCCGGK